MRAADSSPPQRVQILLRSQLVQQIFNGCGD